MSSAYVCANGAIATGTVIVATRQFQEIGNRILHCSTLMLDVKHFWWTVRESNSDLCGANAACSHYH